MADKRVITNLEALVRRLIDEHRKSSGTVRELTAEWDSIKAENRALRERVRSLEKDLARKELTEGLTGRSSDRDKAKARVNRLMREVDKCIALLGSPGEDAGKDV